MEPLEPLMEEDFRNLADLLERYAANCPNPEDFSTEFFDVLQEVILDCRAAGVEN